MKRKRTRNHDQSTAIRIPRTWNSVSELPPSLVMTGVADRSQTERWLREKLEELERFERPSASEGERRAAEWLVTQFAELGAGEARIEAESAHGTFWWPLGIGAMLGALGGFAALRGRRLLGTVLGALGAAGIAGDFPPNRRPLRRLLPKRPTYNVVCELGPADAERTVVVVAHHDAAHSGLIYHPKIPLAADRLGLIERSDTSPMLMAPVVGGPLLAALGALSGRRLLSKAALVLALGTVAAMARHRLARDGPRRQRQRHRRRRPPRPRPRTGRGAAGKPARDPALGRFGGVLQRGDQGLRRAPLSGARRDSTFFLVLESLGSPHLLVLRGEGFLRMHEYPPRALALLDGLADELGLYLYPNLRLHNGTDGLEPLAAGYETAVLCACNDLKQPAFYHWPNDVAANVDFGTVADGIRLGEAAIRRLDQTWL